MRLAGPGHGGSRFRVRTKFEKDTGYHHGYAEYRRGPFWFSAGRVCGHDIHAALRDGIEKIKVHQNPPRHLKCTTYLGDQP